MPKVTLEEVLLPSNVSPIRYALTLEPDLVRCDFKGSESVHIEIHRPTASLKLHAHQLSIDADSVHLHPDGGAPEIPLKGISYDLAMQTVELTFASPIPTGKATLRCTFGGKLSDDLAGFYRSKYTLHGVSRYMAVTQFEATDARRAFPCFDEPAQKAVFGVTITAAAEETVLSNGIVTRCETSPDGRTRTWTFADTPKMASYLVAFVVGHFDCVSAMGKTGVRTTVYTPVGKSALGAFALKVGVAGLELFEQLFGIPYFGGPKCDHIAIADFAAGAMENTGCITYREAALLIDEKESSLAMKQRVAQVVCHGACSGCVGVCVSSCVRAGRQ
jgi:puromycin-sensitive aminopeptidase